MCPVEDFVQVGMDGSGMRYFATEFVRRGLGYDKAVALLRGEAKTVRQGLLPLSMNLLIRMSVGAWEVFRT